MKNRGRGAIRSARLWLRELSQFEFSRSVWKHELDRKLDSTTPKVLGFVGTIASIVGLLVAFIQLTGDSGSTQVGGSASAPDPSGPSTDLIESPHSGDIWATDFDGGGHIASVGSDRHVAVFRIQTGELVNLIRAHDDRIRSVEFDADGSSVLTASNDQTIRVWDVGSGTLVNELQGHERWVWAAT